MGNNRGNMNSPRHVTLTQEGNPKEYFNYSFVELGKYDLPAQVEMVLKKTGTEKLTYIGHSQGTS